MASQARRLSNHYQVLGLSPAASQSEIALAFERAMANFARPLSTTVELYQAFEVLRDPDKRRAYDRSIGLAPEASQPQFLIRSGRGAFKVAACATSKIEPVMPAANDLSKDLAPVPAAQPKTQPAPHTEAARPQLEPFGAQPAPPVGFAGTRRPAPPVQIVDSPRAAAPIESVAKAPAPERIVDPPEPFVLPQGRKPADEAEIDDLVKSILAEGHSERAALNRVERRPHDWRRIGIAAGALMVGAGIVGGIAGISGTRAASDDNAVDVALPAVSPYLEGTAPSRDFDAEAEAQVRAENAVREARRLVAATEARTINPLIVPPGVEVPKERSAKVAPAAEMPNTAEPAAAAVDPLAPNPEETSTAADTAQLPLPNATVARTIQKIGYPCGSVSSVASAGGGVFKVTCSSGHSYRAAPTAGRYRFKKWAGA